MRLEKDVVPSIPKSGHSSESKPLAAKSLAYRHWVCRFGEFLECKYY
jgi:hypothetical protein